MVNVQQYYYNALHPSLQKCSPIQVDLEERLEAGSNGLDDPNSVVQGVRQPPPVEGVAVHHPVRRVAQRGNADLVYDVERRPDPPQHRLGLVHLELGVDRAVVEADQVVTRQGYGLKVPVAKVARSQKLVPSFPSITLGVGRRSTIQGKEGIKFCCLA